MRATHTLPLMAALLTGASAADFNLDSRKAIISSARTLAQDLMSIYTGDEPGDVPGLLPGDDDYFWKSGAFMGAMVDYWHLTGDDQYNDVIQAGILHQVGDDDDFLPANQTMSMGNDDQCYWALTAMTAAEAEFPEDEPTWLDLAQAVYDSQSERIDEDTCDGGLRWQVFNFNIGYNYKDTISNACLMNLAARLARYTGEDKYGDTVDELWDWLVTAELLDEDEWAVYDGVTIRQDDCSDVDSTQWSAPAALLTYTAAVMYNTSSSSTWRERVSGLSSSVLENFFPEDVAVETACEPDDLCNTDQYAYKGLLHKWLAATAVLAPFTKGTVWPVLEKSAEAAVAQCTGGKGGRECGYFWAEGEFRETEGSGAGEQMNVLSAVSNLLVDGAEEPVTAETKGDSKDGGEKDSGDGDEDGESGGNDEGSPTESESAAEATETQPSGAGYAGVSAGMLLATCGLMVFGL